MPGPGASVVPAQQSARMPKNRRNEDDVETLRAAEGLRRRAGFLDGVRWGLVDWIVRGDGTTGGWAGPGARSCTSAGANKNAASGADACTTATHEVLSAEHRKCGRQRGDVYNDLRDAG